MTTTFTSIPTWARPARADRWSFFETMALLKLEGQWLRLSADDQRALLGSVVFGKQEFMVADDGTVTIRRSACFGTTSELAEYDPMTIRAAVAAGKRLSPGTFGPAYL